MLRRMQKFVFDLLRGNEDDDVEVMVLIPCPRCQKQMYLRDVPEHWVMSHGQDVESYKNEVLDKSASVTHTKSGNDVRLRDLVDEYDADWLRDESDDGLELQDASGGHELRAKKLRKRWQNIISRLRSKGFVKIKESDHVGSLRGNDIVTHFKRDFKRMDLGFEIEIELGNPEAVIRKV